MLKQRLEFTLPCGDRWFASREPAFAGAKRTIWRLCRVGERQSLKNWDARCFGLEIDGEKKNAEAIIAAIREISKNTPRGIR